MRMLLPAVSALPLLLSACLCGSYEGQGDVMYRRGTDSLMLCQSGGFSAVMGTSFIEGRYHQAADLEASNGETGARAFTLKSELDGTWSSPELGAGWEIATLDKTELDHAHVQCADLELRPWWPTTNLPVATGFAKPVARFGTVDACLDAQAHGEYPAFAACEDELLLCPDRSAQVRQGDVISLGSYAADVGHITVQTASAATIDGIYASGALATPSSGVWVRRTVGELSTGLSCR